MYLPIQKRPLWIGSGHPISSIGIAEDELTVGLNSAHEGLPEAAPQAKNLRAAYAAPYQVQA